ncbi:hypothetical protein WME90_16245 [Sorangium sp. So ce375]|uniref:hypothetical protein n=1 Tax=Sorangium sp. So ce375 TaxID=3133306 RepID=UPI003F5C533D
MTGAAGGERSWLLQALALSRRLHRYLAPCASPRAAGQLVAALSDELPRFGRAEVRLVRLEPYSGRTEDSPLTISELAAILDTPRVLGAPRRPYRPAPPWYRRCARRFVQLPIQATPGPRLPVIGTSVALADATGARFLARACADEVLVNLELDGMDFLDRGDGLRALAPHQPELRVALGRRIEALGGVRGGDPAARGALRAGGRGEQGARARRLIRHRLTGVSTGSRSGTRSCTRISCRAWCRRVPSRR